MSQKYIQRGNLKVAQQLDQFIRSEALPGAKISQDDLWSRFEKALPELLSQNKRLLNKRIELQSKIDWYCESINLLDIDSYKTFLEEIGYIQPAPKDFDIGTSNVDPEIATMAGPQLVVPINNARFALNAANARWGSLYDALYGSDVIKSAPAGKTYDSTRGEAVTTYAKTLLDTIVPLASGSHKNATHYDISSGKLLVTLGDSSITQLANPTQLCGFEGDISTPNCILLKHHKLHLELQFDSKHPIGRQDKANLKDIILESALTTIMDCEDSVAAVDAEDKTEVYRNWLGLIKGSLTAKINKQTERRLNNDRRYQSMTGEIFSLSGRSLMFVRNVGHLMTTDAILFNDQPIYEGIMDALITSLIAKHDLLDNGKYRNSSAGSIYIVKPKMHGPEEVSFADQLFSAVESIIDIPPLSLKMGLMDEERRTSLNLKACIKAARNRVVFINTGFLDRTGDEIHTSMKLGAFATKAEIKGRVWLDAYEKSNVSNGLNSGLSGKAQIGKGMWPIPDKMAKMMTEKISHVRSGANTAWVPSPTAATLHALHYHQEDVFDIRANLIELREDLIERMLTVPLLDVSSITKEQIQNELDNNIQGILGYVVRWINQGVGCSKVPDINNVGLMEDRATLRISSQHIANWLEHKIITEEQVCESMHRMAQLVDAQNAADLDYIAFTSTPDKSIAYQAAKLLIFTGAEQPNGYTEPLLHEKRLALKAESQTFSEPSMKKDNDNINHSEALVH